VLGEQVKQSGSAVDDKRLRFDFTHMKKLSQREIEKVENIVNGWIEESVPVCKEVKALDQAKEEGALSFFGEKYGDTVRVVSVGDYSKELCGGTHVDNTADIGAFKIITESSVASGIRRIEAVTGENAGRWVRETLENLLRECQKAASGDIGIEKDIENSAKDIISGKLKVDRKTISIFDEKIRPALLEARERLEKAAKKDQKEKRADAFNEAKNKADDFAGSPIKIGETDLVAGVIEGADMQVLRKVIGYLEKKIKSGIILMGSGEGDKAYLVCAVTPDLVNKGFSAKEVISAVSKNIEGSGGGKDVFAQAGGKKPEGLKAAIDEAKNVIEQRG
jgi:alanyl-tRNA synthetase